MRPMIILAAAGAALALAACDSREAQRVENAQDQRADSLDDQADRIEQAADSMNGAAGANAADLVDRLEDRADAVRNAGDEAADAIESAR